MSTSTLSIPAAIRDRISAPAQPRVWIPEDFCRPWTAHGRRSGPPPAGCFPRPAAYRSRLLRHAPGHPIRWERCPLVAADPHACSWLTLQSHRGLASNTLDAYSRALERYLGFLKLHSLVSTSVTRGDLGLYLATLQTGKINLSNSTIQQLLTVVRLFHAYLMEEGAGPNNPAAQNSSGRPMVARHHKLPWIPNEEDWHCILASARQESIRNRTMLAFAYDAGLRREELCSLQSGDIDPSRRMLRIRAESTKGRRERALPYSASSGELLLQYLEHRRTLGQKRGPLFLSESRRNYTEPISIWSWSKIVLHLARRAGVERFTTHTLRHLCLTDLARAGWDIHEIATFAGHRSVQTTLLYIHLSGRDLSLKLAASMAQVHARRAQMLAEVTR
jgi:integrase/recombinase XerD